MSDKGQKQKLVEIRAREVREVRRQLSPEDYQLLKNNQRPLCSITLRLLNKDFSSHLCVKNLFVSVGTEDRYKQLWMVSLQKQAVVSLQQNYWSACRGSDPADTMFCIMSYLLFISPPFLKFFPNQFLSLSSC